VLVDGVARRTIGFGDDGSVEVIDQTRLPHEFAVARWYTVSDAARGITTMQVRGAPLIGVAAAHGLALAMDDDPSDTGLAAAARLLVATRPTAVNLAWAVTLVRDRLSPLAPGERPAVARAVARELADADVVACRAIGDTGAPLLVEAAAEAADGTAHVMTHCNAGWLATVDWGTALAPVYRAHDDGVPVHVWVSETRPRNQGSALTAWELGAHGVPHTVVADNACGHLLATGPVGLCLVGADRVAANGDVANKVGTYLKALAAAAHRVPFYVAAPISTLDPSTPHGAAIAIEERDGEEVHTIAGVAADGSTRLVRLTPAAAVARNWAFDVTPAALVSAIVTERGIVPASHDGVRAATAR
jgi:methylthioribose-1-phosphate isomerase